MKKKSIGTLLASLLGVMALAGTANAAPIVDRDTGDLTVHKFEQPVEWGPDTNGKPLPADELAKLKPMEGVVFEIQQVNPVNLKENEDWLKADTLIKDFQALTATEQIAWTPPTGYTLGNAQTATTDAQGSAEFAGIPIGLYLVTEKSAPAVEGKAITKALPFLVTVPLTDVATGDNWFYDVNVYPKNIITGVEKEIVDIDAYGVGDTVQYTFYGDIPGGEPAAKYVLWDQLDSKLEYVNDSAKVKFGSTTATVTTDYTVDYTGGKVTITLTEAGRLAAYNALKADNTAKVVVTIDATVMSGIDGCVPNKVTLEFENKPGYETEVESKPVDTCWGGLKIFKHDTDGSSSPLAGAVFEIWGSHTDDFATATKVTVDGVDNWTTGADGKLTVSGLRYSDHANNVSPAPAGGYNYYWVKEIKAPEGYLLQAEPIPFTVDTEVANAPVIDVPNTPDKALPKTGAEGILPILIIGAGLLGAGVFFTRRTAAKKEN